MRQAQKQLEEQRIALASLDKERTHSAHLKSRLSIAEKQLKSLDWEHEVRSLPT